MRDDDDDDDGSIRYEMSIDTGNLDSLMEGGEGNAEDSPQQEKGRIIGMESMKSVVSKGTVGTTNTAHF